MRIYIAGPITGIFDYKEKFKVAEHRMSSLGHIVLNPSFLPDGLKNYMPICKAMIDQADGVYFMSGWTNSVGSREEFQYAEDIGKKIFEEKALAIKGEDGCQIKEI